jgi:Ca2+-binding EF-hand superfamily protein
MNRSKIIVAVVAITMILSASTYLFAQGSPGGRMSLGKRFQAMDTDQDGKVSRSEYMTYSQKAAERRFQRVDANGDGFLTKEEQEESMSGFRKKAMQRMKSVQ